MAAAARGRGSAAAASIPAPNALATRRRLIGSIVALLPVLSLFSAASRFRRYGTRRGESSPFRA